MSTYTIGQLARLAGLSRAALLYYEARGLLVARARSAAGYRRYGAEDLARLRRICDYRATGMPLAAIGALLDGADAASLIGQRLDAIAADMARLREQQAVLLRLLGSSAPGALGKEAWTGLLRAAGVDEPTMERWHALFEQQAPQAHQGFLRSLGLDEEEVARIRGWARQIRV
ncbi:MAG TPA: MerR family transcriptional regulator [Telluria sp.]|nr:MerR family transcriptional regulator [Telluria sp.]